MTTVISSDCLVLIDGFNLYHSLRAIEKETGKKVRWLDVRALSQRLVGRVFPGEPCPYPHILLFTAYAVHEDEEHQIRQKEYYQCLKRLRIDIITDGRWATKTLDLKYHFRTAPWWIKWYLIRRHRFCQCHQEKGTDVAISAHLMHLGAKAKWVCLVTGDADLIPALDLFRFANPSVKLAMARPYKRENRQLNRYLCTDISIEDCEACLLPNPAKTKKRVVHKPAHW